MKKKSLIFISLLIVLLMLSSCTIIPGSRLEAMFRPGGSSSVIGTGGAADTCGDSVTISREEYEKLPPDIREIVGNSRMLHEWAQMDSSEVNTIIAAGFKRSWRARQELKQELLPLAGIPQMHLGEQEKREF